MDNIILALIVAAVFIVLIGAFVYLGRLAIRERVDLEAGGRSGLQEFFIKTKVRK